MQLNMLSKDFIYFCSKAIANYSMSDRQKHRWKDIQDKNNASMHPVLKQSSWFTVNYLTKLYQNQTHYLTD